MHGVYECIVTLRNGRFPTSRQLTTDSRAFRDFLE
jgi:hypothetical protein